VVDSIFRFDLLPAAFRAGRCYIVSPFRGLGGARDVTGVLSTRVIFVSPYENRAACAIGLRYKTWRGTIII
jgi:hypothetical protein